MNSRPTLGDFNSIECFKAVITGVEDTLGDGAGVVFTRAGRVRGSNVMKDLGLSGKNLPPDEITKALNAAVGKDGTRLCLVTGARNTGSAIEVDTQETVCSAAEAPGAGRLCTFTLGVVWGALEEITGQRLEAKHTASVLRGGDCDRFVFTRQ